MDIPSPLEITRDLIRFRSINPPGDEQQAQIFLSHLLQNNGFEVKQYKKLEGRPNLVTRFPGLGKSPPLLFYGHTDVVGVDGQIWSQPPFEAHEKDGILYGRGTLDMKAGLASMVHALIKARKNNLRPSGDIIMAIVVDEETGGAAGMQYLLNEHPQLFAGVKHAIGEFGGFPLYGFGKKFYRIGISQKQYAHIRLHFQAPAGHGSLPARNTVMAKLGRALVSLDQLRMPYHKTPVAEQTVNTILRYLDDETGQPLKLLLDPQQFETGLNKLGSLQPVFESMFRDTANPTIVSSGKKFNVIPGAAQVDIDARILPGRTTEDVLAALRAILEEDVKIEVLAEGPQTKEEIDFTLFPLLAGILTEMDPLGLPIPYLFNESPDGRLLEAAGMQNYGFLPMNLPPDLDLPFMIHAEDERIPVSAIDFCANALYKLMERY